MFDPNRLGRLCDWMQGYVDQRKYAGSALLVRQNGNEVFFNSCGRRSLEDNLPFQRDTIARIYSMTKPVTTVALMLLVERGYITLGTQLSDIILEFSSSSALIPGAEHIGQTEEAPSPTLHQIVTHTSGFSYPFNPGLLPQAMDEADLIFSPAQGLLADRVTDLAALPLAFRPGTRWEYSVGIDVIGRVVEIVSGQPLDEFLQAEIFDPLEMAETGFRVPQGGASRFASLYSPLEGNAMALNAATPGRDTLRLVDEAADSPFLATTTFSGGGGLVGTIDDYSRFAEMLLNKGQFGRTRLLSPQTVEFMMRNHLSGDIASMGPTSFAEQPMTGMGFGLGGSVVLDPALTGTPGSVGDFSWGGMASTFFWIDPKNDLNVVFFTQLSPSSSYPSRAELKALVLGALIE